MFSRSHITSDVDVDSPEAIAAWDAIFEKHFEKQVVPQTQKENVPRVSTSHQSLSQSTVAVMDPVQVQQQPESDTNSPSSPVKAHTLDPGLARLHSTIKALQAHRNDMDDANSRPKFAFDPASVSQPGVPLKITNPVILSRFGKCGSTVGSHVYNAPSDSTYDYVVSHRSIHPSAESGLSAAMSLPEDTIAPQWISLQTQYSSHTRTRPLEERVTPSLRTIPEPQASFTAAMARANNTFNPSQSARPEPQTSFQAAKSRSKNVVTLPSSEDQANVDESHSGIPRPSLQTKSTNNLFAPLPLATEFHSRLDPLHSYPGLSFEAIRKQFPGAGGSVYDESKLAEIERRRKETLERRILQNEIETVKASAAPANVKSSSPAGELSSAKVGTQILSDQEEEMTQDVKFQANQNSFQYRPNPTLERQVGASDISQDSGHDPKRQMPAIPTAFDPRQLSSEIILTLTPATPTEMEISRPQPRKRELTPTSTTTNAGKENLHAVPQASSPLYSITSEQIKDISRRANELATLDPGRQVGKATLEPSVQRDNSTAASFRPTSLGQFTPASRAPGLVDDAATFFGTGDDFAAFKSNAKSHGGRSAGNGMKPPILSRSAMDDLEGITYFKAWPAPPKRDGPAPKLRKLLLRNVSANSGLREIADLVFGGVLEELHYVRGSTSATVTFLDPVAAARYHAATANGISVPGEHNRVVWVDLDPQVMPLHADLMSYLEKGVTRVVRVVGITEQLTKAQIMALVRKGCGDKSELKVIEHIIMKPMDGGTFNIDFRMASIKEALKLSATLRRDPDWEHCHVRWAEDPCSLAKAPRYRD